MSIHWVTGPAGERKLGVAGINAAEVLLLLPAPLSELSAEGRTVALFYRCSISRLFMQGTEGPT